MVVKVTAIGGGGGGVRLSFERLSGGEATKIEQVRTRW